MRFDVKQGPVHVGIESLNPGQYAPGITMRFEARDRITRRMSDEHIEKSAEFAKQRVLRTLKSRRAHLLALED